MIDEQELYQKALDKWGIDLQLIMMIEECAELIQAITSLKRGGDVEELIEEIADVKIMLGQMEMVFGHERLGNAVESKLRQLQIRIKE